MHLDMHYWNVDQTTVEKSVFMDVFRILLNKEKSRPLVMELFNNRIQLTHLTSI